MLPFQEADFVHIREAFTELWRCRYTITEITKVGVLSSDEHKISVAAIDRQGTLVGFDGTLSTFDISERDRESIQVNTILVNVGGRSRSENGTVSRKAFWVVE